MVTIDGSRGEGGGQIVRTSLALALVTGRPFRIERVRGRRERPGLRRQHLTAVQAAARIGEAEVDGAELGSATLTFRPRAVRPGDYHLRVGTAGSATLVIQTVLPVLLTAAGRSRLHVEGGTHNPMAPPFEFLDRAFFPVLRRIGARVEARLDRPGFFPAGGGAVTVVVEPVSRLGGIELTERGAERSRRVAATVSRLPESIARREVDVVKRELGGEDTRFEIRTVDSAGPGNVVTIELAFEHVTEVFTGFGMRGVRAETVASRAVGSAVAYLEAGVPVGPHLADQLMLPIALAGEGRYLTTEPSAHVRTQADVIRTFLGVDVGMRKVGGTAWEIAV